MTPVEGAVYLGVPNLLFIRYSGKPPMPFDQYAIAFRPLKRVVWSLVGASGQSSDEERKHVLELAGRFPNIVGFIMDDLLPARWDRLAVGRTTQGVETAAGHRREEDTTSSSSCTSTNSHCPSRRTWSSATRSPSGRGRRKTSTSWSPPSTVWRSSPPGTASSWAATCGTSAQASPCPWS